MFHVIFLIDDVSILGTTYYDKDGIWRPILLAHSKEFLDIMSKSPNLDGVFAVSRCKKDKYIWFINQKELDEYYLNTEDYGNGKFRQCKPCCTGVK